MPQRSKRQGHLRRLARPQVLQQTQSLQSTLRRTNYFDTMFSVRMFLTKDGGLHRAHSDGEGGHGNLKCCVDRRESGQVGSGENWSCDGDDGGGIAGDLVVVGVLCDPRVDLGADADEA